MRYSDELYHYGRLGMKWGQHVFTHTSSKKSEKNRKAFNELYDRLNDDDKMKVTGVKNSSHLDKELASPLEYKYYVAKNFVTRLGGKPVSALSIDRLNSQQAMISILTDPDHRGKGLASSNTRKAMRWLEKGSSFTEVYWNVRVDNISSRRLAEKYGFKEDRTNDGWMSYSKELKRGKSK